MLLKVPEDVGGFLPCNLSKSINENLVAIYSWCMLLGE